MKYRIVSLGLSLVLYGIALALPCILFEIVPIDTSKVPNPKDYEIEMNGFELTWSGLFRLIFLQIAAVGWLANPVYLLCCAFFARQKYKIAVIAALTSVAVGFGGTLLGFWFKLRIGLLSSIKSNRSASHTILEESYASNSSSPVGESSLYLLVCWSYLSPFLGNMAANLVGDSGKSTNATTSA